MICVVLVAWFDGIKFQYKMNKNSLTSNTRPHFYIHSTTMQYQNKCWDKGMQVRMKWVCGLECIIGNSYKNTYQV